MANPFEVAPVNLSGLGMIANAYGQKSQQDQMKEDQMMEMEQQKAGASNAMKLLNQANMAQDPAERERLFMEAYQSPVSGTARSAVSLCALTDPRVVFSYHAFVCRPLSLALRMF